MEARFHYYKLVHNLEYQETLCLSCLLKYWLAEMHLDWRDLNSLTKLEENHSAPRAFESLLRILSGEVFCLNYQQVLVHWIAWFRLNPLQIGLLERQAIAYCMQPRQTELAPCNCLASVRPSPYAVA